MVTRDRERCLHTTRDRERCFVSISLYLSTISLSRARALSLSLSRARAFSLSTISRSLSLSLTKTHTHRFEIHMAHPSPTSGAPIDGNNHPAWEPVTRQVKSVLNSTPASRACMYTMTLSLEASRLLRFETLVCCYSVATVLLMCC
jgi:hypothetical protein